QLRLPSPIRSPPRSSAGVVQAGCGQAAPHVVSMGRPVHTRGTVHRPAVGGGQHPGRSMGTRTVAGIRRGGGATGGGGSPAKGRPSIQGGPATMGGGPREARGAGTPTGDIARGRRGFSVRWGPRVGCLQPSAGD